MASTVAAAKKPQSQPPPAVQPVVDATPPRVRTLAEVSPEYARAAVKLDGLNRDLTAARGELEQLQAELGTTETSTVRLEALELLGENTPGVAADLADKHARLKTARNRVAVISEAVKLHTPVVDAARAQAWRQLMTEATPTWKALLAVHAVSVVAAAKSRLAVVQFCEAIEAGAPLTQSGFGDHSFTPLGDSRAHCGRASLWIGELISIGILDVNEPWLADLPVIARRPDGSTVDRASPVPAYMAPPPPPAKGKSVLGAVGAAVRQGAAAVASAFAPAQRTGDVDPNDPALPYPSQLAAIVGSTGPSAEGPMKEITLHRGMANSREEWPAGWSGQWPSADAENLVRRGFASWGASPSTPAPVVSTPAVAVPSEA